MKSPSLLAAYLYTFGNAGSGSTYSSNLEALEQWRIVPRMLRDATNSNLDVTTSIAALPC
jgi:lactate 2-monooxygenase